MVWLEIGHFHISANTCDRDLKLGRHLGDQFKNLGGNIFLVWLEFVPVLNGSTWKWTFRYIGGLIVAFFVNFCLGLTCICTST